MKLRWAGDSGASELERFQQRFVILSRVKRGNTKKPYGTEKVDILRGTALLAHQLAGKPTDA